MSTVGETGGDFKISRLEQFRKTIRKIEIGSLFKFGKKFIPVISWLPGYNWRHSFFGDLSGGLTMAVLAVPQGLVLL